MLAGINERLRETLGRSEEVGLDEGSDGADKPSIRDRLEGVLNRPRESLEIKEERDHGKDQEVEKDGDIDGGRRTNCNTCNVSHTSGPST